MVCSWLWDLRSSLLGQQAISQAALEILRKGIMIWKRFVYRDSGDRDRAGRL
jgi:hypothetical protein